MNKFKSFLIIITYVLGTIGGFGYALYGGSWPIAIAIIVLSILAFPEVKKAWQELNEVIKSKFKK